MNYSKRPRGDRPDQGAGAKRAALRYAEVIQFFMNIWNSHGISLRITAFRTHIKGGMLNAAFYMEQSKFDDNLSNKTVEPEFYWYSLNATLFFAS
jgi:hypothetical protein